MGHLSIVKRLLQHGADVNARSVSFPDYISTRLTDYYPDHDGDSALHLAAEHGYLDIVEMIFDFVAESDLNLNVFSECHNCVRSRVYTLNQIDSNEHHWTWPARQAISRL
jgi:ankyrin repeat protein